MLIWLNGNQNVKGHPNENYAPRDDGALLARRRPRRLHRDRRARAGARAHRLDGRRQQGRASATSPSTRTGTTARHEDDLRADGQLHLAGLGQPLPQPPAAPVVLRQQAVGLLRPDAARRGDRRPRSQALYTATGFKVHPVVEAILQHPLFYSSPRMVKPPVVLNAGLLRMLGPPDRHVGLVVALRVGGPAALLPAGRRRLGLHALARHGHLARALVHRGARAGHDAPPTARLERSRRSSSQRAIGFWGSPTDLVADARRCSSAFAKAQLDAEGRPGRRRDRAPPARRHLSRPPDRMSSGCRDCNRTEILRRAVAEAGRGLPGIEPGMPLPAGTGLTRRDFVSRTAGLALGIYGGGALSAPRVRGRDRAPRRPTPPQNVLVVVYLSGGIDGLSVLFPAGDPMYYQLRPNIALAQTAGTPFTEDNRLRWHPTASGLATLHGEGKVSVIPAIGYVNNDESHFTSRHYWEVGATDATLRTGWLGRYLDHDRHASTTRCRGSRSTSRCSRRSRRRRCRSRRSRRPTSTRSRRPASPPHPLEVVDAPGGGEHRRRARDVDRRRARDGRLDRARVAPPLHASSARSSTASTSRSPYPATTDPFPHRLAGLAAMIAAGLPLRVVTITSPGHFDTHASQAAALNERAAADVRLAARLPARPRGARRRRPRADLRLVGVRPPRAGERLGRHRPRLGRDRVPDRHAGRTASMIGAFPGRHRRAQQPRQPAADRRLPGRVRRRSSSSGSAPTRTRSSRTSRGYQRPTLLK